MNYENTARVINDDIFDLINQCFDEERSSRNNEARLNFFDTYKNYFVLTDDGSYSINSKEINHKIINLKSFEKLIINQKMT